MSKYIVGNGIQVFHYWRNNLQIRNEGTGMGEWADSVERALWFWIEVSWYQCELMF